MIGFKSMRETDRLLADLAGCATYSHLGFATTDNTFDLFLCWGCGGASKKKKKKEKKRENQPFYTLQTTTTERKRERDREKSKPPRH